MLHSIFDFYFISGTGEKYENDSFVAISERKSNFVNDNKPLQQYFIYFYSVPKYISVMEYLFE